MGMPERPTIKQSIHTTPAQQNMNTPAQQNMNIADKILAKITLPV